MGQELGEVGCMHSLYRGQYWKQRYRKSKPEVAASVRPGVYKIPMVRMFSFELTNLRMYGSKRARSRKGFDTVIQWSVRSSKNL